MNHHLHSDDRMPAGGCGWDELLEEAPQAIDSIEGASQKEYIEDILGSVAWL